MTFQISYIIIFDTSNKSVAGEHVTFAEVSGEEVVLFSYSNVCHYVRNSGQKCMKRVVELKNVVLFILR